MLAELRSQDLPMNDELHTALRQLVLAAGPQWSTAIEKSLANSKCLMLAIHPVDEAELDHNSEHSYMRLGGRPLMSPGFAWPLDRAGQYMQFLLQVDIKNINPPGQASLDMPSSGYLSVFRSGQILTMADKDRKAFHLHFEAANLSKVMLAAPDQNQPLPPLKGHTFTVAAGWALDLERLNYETLAFALPQNFAMALLGWAEKYNLSICAAGHFFGSAKNLEEEKEICAFAAGGISYDSTRARDSHYSHLIALKDNWILLARVYECAVFKTTISTTDILIQKEDLAQGLFERAWVISR